MTVKDEGADAVARMRPSFHVLAKPAGAACNLDCAYCFFLSKDLLYPNVRQRMSEETLDRYLHRLFEAHRGQPEVTVAWQGGEPTLMGLDFFRRSVEVAEGLREPGQDVLHTVQTNGILLDDEWCSFFASNHFLVGLSIDGPQAMHDAYRVDRGGSGTHERVMRAWERLQSHEVDTNVLCTLHAANAGHPLEVYRFFRDDLGARFIQFIPIVERTGGDDPRSRPGDDRASAAAANDAPRTLYTQTGDRVTERSVRPDQYGGFLIAVFEEWVRRDVGTVYVQHFDATLASVVGEPSICIYSPTCGTAPALEFNGDLYSCDHFVEPGYLLGNILDDDLVTLLESERQLRFGADKRDRLPGYCQACPVLQVCNGECPRNRFLTTPDGEAGLNYLCAGLRSFFTHVDRPMRFMAGQLRRDLPPAAIMREYASQDDRLSAALASAGRNDPCPCGSGRKLKHCHGVG